MLLDDLNEKRSFTHQEGLLADYLLGHLEDLETFSISDLAKASYTSKATVVRMSQKLGLSGYQELKLKLLIEVNQKKRMSQLLSQEPITGESRYQDIVETIPALYDKAITNTKLSMSKGKLNRIANFVNQADSIDLYGVGISYLVAQTAAFKFETLGRESQAYESLNHHYISARKEKKRVSLVISFTGNNPQVIDMTRYLKKTTTDYIVGIAGPRNEQLSNYCDELIEIPNRDSILSLDVMSSFTGTVYVLDVLFALLLSKQYNQHVLSSLKMLESFSDIEE